MAGRTHAGPGRRVDGWLARPRSVVSRTVLWALANYVLLLLAMMVGFLAVAAPPLAWLPSEEPLRLADLVLGVVVYGAFGWPLHLAVVAAVSRTRRARLWTVLSTPLLTVIVFGLPYLLATVDATNRAVVLAFVLYGLVARLHPRAHPPSLNPG